MQLLELVAHPPPIRGSDAQRQERLADRVGIIGGDEVAHMPKHRLTIMIVRPVHERKTFGLPEAAVSVLDHERSAEVIIYALVYAAPVRAHATSIVIEVERPRFR